MQEIVIAVAVLTNLPDSLDTSFLFEHDPDAAQPELGTRVGANTNTYVLLRK
jgi:hypothetical protein